MRLFILDNYDSFTYNLVHYFAPLVEEVIVQRNDEVIWEEMDTCDVIVLSPGPGLPSEAPNLMETIKRYAGRKPILGVCLGMQALAEATGGRLRNQSQVKHGKQEQIHVSNHNGLFNELPAQFAVGLYHSWEVLADSLPKEWICSAFSENNVLMAIESESQSLYGVQFHPESILSENGEKILKNFLELGKR